MKKLIISFLAAGFLAALVGCNTSTFESRIKENQSEFTKLPEIDQQIIRNGFIKIGYTPALVYIALEKPERKIPGATANEETWVYHNFYASDGSSLTPAQKIKTNYAGASGSGTGSSPVAGGKPNNNTFSVVPDLAQENIKAESMIKVYVKFVDGKVASIDIIRPN